MISVIVPVYNAEKYIERCVNSILAQIYPEWELYLIDDGSEDNSLEIIKKFAKLDSRINVIHQENQGAGVTRNKGITLAQGEYVVFVDSDDYIEDNYFSLLSKHREDIVFIDVNRRDETGKIVSSEKLSIYKEKEKEDILRGQMTGKILWGGVRKAVKLSLLQKNDIRYSDHHVGEEAIYSFLLLYYADTFAFIDTPVYNYEVHSGSLSQSIHVDPWGDVAISLKDQIINLKCYPEFADTLNGFFVTAKVVSLSKLAKIYTYNAFKKEAIKKCNYYDAMIDKTYRIDKNNMSKKARIIDIFIKLRLFWIIYITARLR